MKQKDINNALKCPNCGSEKLNVSFRSNKLEKVTCLACSSEYSADENDMVCLLPKDLPVSNEDKEKYIKFKDYWAQFDEGFPEGSEGFNSRQFVDFCDIKKDEKVLEIGVGAGHTPDIIKNITDNAFYIDFDSKSVLTQIKRDRELNVFVADALRLPFKNNVFDKVIARYTIHNLPTAEMRAKIVGECCRVARSGGQIVFGMVPNKTGMFFDLRNWLTKEYRDRLAKEHFMFWPMSVKDMNKELKLLGCELISIRGTPIPKEAKGKKWYLRKMLLPLFIKNPIISDFVDLKYRKIK